MSSAGAVRAGRAFVEISANDSEFQRAVKRVQHSVVRIGNVMRSVGSGLAIGGVSMGLPMVLAARQAATFEDALLELQGAVSDIRPDQLAKVRKEALRLSSEMGVAPSKIAQAFALLIKAGLTVEKALDGAARSAVEFARVSGVDAQEAATFMKVAMNVFGVSAAEAVDTLSAAADASETDIRHMVEAFSLVGSAGKTFQQSLFGVSQSFAALARYGIQGEEAGTGVKVLLSRLVAPSDEAAKALAVLGLSVEAFRDAEGGLLPIAQIVEIISKRLRGMSKEARGVILSQRALVDVFGDRGIKVISAFADMGRDGFDALASAMEENRTVGDKFAIAMSGITGSFERMSAAVERLSIAFMSGLNPALAMFSRLAAPLMDVISFLLTSIPILSPVLASVAAIMTVLGVGLLGVGVAMQAVNFAAKGLVTWSLTWSRVGRAVASVVGNLAKALAVLRVAMLAIPGWGWLLAGLAIAGGVALSFRNSRQSKSSGSGIKRDEFRKPLADAIGGAQLPAASDKGEGSGTFSGAVARQLGIGPALGAAEQTADNTGRIADGVDELVAQGRIMPDPAGLWAAASAVNVARPAIASGVSASSDKELLSVNERAAIAAEQSRDFLRELVQRRGSTIAFVA